MQSPPRQISPFAASLILPQPMRMVLPMPKGLMLELKGVSHCTASPLSPSPLKKRSFLSNELHAAVELPRPQTTLNCPAPSNRLQLFRLEKRKSYRKQAEKIRRDQLSSCMFEVRQLLPQKYQATNLSKEATVAAAYACIVELKEEEDRKTQIVKDLEAQLYAEILLRLHEA